MNAFALLLRQMRGHGQFAADVAVRQNAVPVFKDISDLAHPLQPPGADTLKISINAFGDK